MKSVRSILVVLWFILSGCSGRNHDARLDSAMVMAEEDPIMAMCVLDSVDYESLSAKDRHLFDLLSIKAKDKAYIHHESDSLILDVIDWYGSDQKSAMYAEALYYGGRVYSDLGNYPMALRYFQMAIDKLPDSSEYLRLKASVLSQTGRLLNTLCLYEEATGYIEKALEIDKAINDTANIIYDMQLLGHNFMNYDQCPLADKAFREAMDLSRGQYATHALKSRMYLAAVRHQMGDIDSALLLIRPIPSEIKPSLRNSALCYASKIYLDAGLPDTAYRYAHEIINSSNSFNKEIAYQLLLSSELRKYSHPDTLLSYMDGYANLLQDYYDDNENQLALNQQSLYNYQIHEREKEKAQQSRRMLFRILLYIMAFLVFLVFIVFYLRYRNKTQLLKLNEALNDIQTLRRELESAKAEAKDASESEKPEIEKVADCGNLDACVGVASRNPEYLRDRLREELMQLRSTLDDDYNVPEDILRSDVYERLKLAIKEKKIIVEDSPEWDEIEAVVTQCSPDFRKRLTLLLGGALKQTDLHISLLIKCGVSTTEMSVLAGRAKSTIVYRRNALGLKLFDCKTDLDVIDDIIRLL